MKLSSILVLVAAALTTASPIVAVAKRDEGTIAERAVHPKPVGTFHITEFQFGCTVTCHWSFKVSVSGSSKIHPPVKIPVSCEGDTTKDKDFVRCSDVVKGGNVRHVMAWVSHKTSALRVKYVFTRYPFGDQNKFIYTGNKIVYPEGIQDYKKYQKPHFDIEEGSYAIVPN